MFTRFSWSPMVNATPGRGLSRTDACGLRLRVCDSQAFSGAGMGGESQTPQNGSPKRVSLREALAFASCLILLSRLFIRRLQQRGAFVGKIIISQLPESGYKASRAAMNGYCSVPLKTARGCHAPVLRRYSPMATSVREAEQSAPTSPSRQSPARAHS